MAQLTITPQDCEAVDKAGVSITAKLTDADGNLVAGFTPSGDMVRTTVATSNGEDAIVLDLVPNADINPGNSYYTVRVGPFDYLVEKTSSAQTLQQSLVEDPQDLELPVMVQAVQTEVAALAGTLVDLADSPAGTVPVPATATVLGVEDGGVVQWDNNEFAGGGAGTVDVVSNVAAARILGRVTSGSGDSEELTGTQAWSVLDDASPSTAMTWTSGVSIGDGTAGNGQVDILGTVLGGLVSMKRTVGDTNAATILGSDLGLWIGAGDGTWWKLVHNLADSVTVTGTTTFSGAVTVPDGNFTGLKTAAASDTARGTVELATSAETATGSSTTLAVTPAGAAATYQVLDSDLSAIAALSTVAFGRSVLTWADAAAGRTALALGSLATASTIVSADITDGTIVNGDISGSAAIAWTKLALPTADVTWTVGHTINDPDGLVIRNTNAGAGDIYAQSSDAAGAITSWRSSTIHTYGRVMIGTTLGAFLGGASAGTIALGAGDAALPDWAIYRSGAAAATLIGSLTSATISATTSIAGLTEYATAAETITGTDATRTVTALGLASVVNLTTVAGKTVPSHTPTVGSPRRLDNTPTDRPYLKITPLTTSSVRTEGMGGNASLTGTVTTPTVATVAHTLMNIASAASTNADANVRQTVDAWYRGAGADLYGGWNLYAVVRFPDASYANTGASTGTRIYCGMSGTVPVTSARLGSVHFAGFNWENVNGAATDTNWQFVVNDGGATAAVTDTGIALAQNKVYEMIVTCPAGATTIYWTINNLTDATTASGTAGAGAATDLPGATTNTYPLCGLRTVDAKATTIQVGELYVEADKG